MTSSDETVAKLMADAIKRTTYPYAFLAESAARMTAPGATDRLPSGARRRLEVSEAHAALTAVTRLMRRYSLAPSSVCAAAGVANEAKDFYKYHLTAAEMDVDGNLVAPLPASRRVRKSIGPFVRMVREVARLAEVEEAEALQEFGSAIAGYLAPFDVAPLDPYEELADDLGALAAFFAKPREGSDGEPIDLRDFYSSVAREAVGFVPRRGVMVDASEDATPDQGHWQAPNVPLFVRTVASGTVRCSGLDRTAPLAARRVPLGTMRVNVVEVVYVGLVPTGKGLRTVLFAEPWTVTYGKPGSAADQSWWAKPSGFTRGTPFPPGLHVVDGDNAYDVCFEGAPTLLCPVYAAHARETLEPASADFRSAEIDVARRVEPDAAILRVWLERQDDQKWRSAVGRLPGDTDFPTRMMLPPSTELASGKHSTFLSDRLREALYGEDLAIVSGLTDEVTKRVRAMDSLLSTRSGTENLRKARFRRLMRS